MGAAVWAIVIAQALERGAAIARSVDQWAVIEERCAKPCMAQSGELAAVARAVDHRVHEQTGATA